MQDPENERPNQDDAAESDPRIQEILGRDLPDNLAGLPTEEDEDDGRNEPEPPRRGRRTPVRTRTEPTGSGGKGNKKLYIAAAAAAVLIIVLIGAIVMSGGDEEGGENGAAPAAQDQDGQVAQTLADLTMKMDSLNDRLSAMEATDTEGNQGGETEPDNQTGGAPGEETPEPTVEAPATAPTETPTEQPAPTAIPTEPAPATPAPTPTEPAPARPGICGRSPAVQDVILQKLSIASCRSVTDDELYRITELPDIEWTDVPRAGDFAGLQNLSELTFVDPREAEEQTPLAADTFMGLNGVQKMELTVSGLESRALMGLDEVVTLTLNISPEGTIKPGAFQGMPELENLTINSGHPTKVVDRRDFLPIFDRMPRIRSVTLNTQGWNILMKPGQFKNLTTLQILNITGEVKPEDPVKVYWLPASLFAANTYLSDIEIDIQGPGTVIKTPPELVEHLEALRYLTFHHSPDPESDEGIPKLYLNLKSTLLEDITNGRQTPQGYEVALQGG